MDHTDKLTAGAPISAPLYKEVKRRLMHSLAAGDWRPGEALPAERVLADRFDVAIGTLRKAVDELVQENMLVRQQGRGTFVATHNRDRTLFHFFHVVPREGTKEYPVVHTLSFKRGKAPPEAALKLGVPKGAPAFLINNLLSIGGEPIVLDELVLAQLRFPGLTERQFCTRPNTIYHLYQSAFGITVVRSVERLRAILADERSAQALKVEPGAPLLEIRRVALTYNDVPVEYRRSLVNTERHEYFSDLGRSER